MRTLISILFIITIWSCGQKVNTEDIKSITIDTTKFFLPLEAFTDTASYVGRDTFFVDRYTQKLRALGEHSLLKEDGSKEIYRLLWLRTFENPVVIRIERDKESYQLYWKVSSGKGGYEPGELTTYKSRQISKTEWNKFEELINKMEFWTSETVEKKLHGDDGSRWVIEGVSENGYHVTDRWTPKNNDYRTCGEFLIKLTDLEIGEDKMY